MPKSSRKTSSARRSSARSVSRASVTSRRRAKSASARAKSASRRSATGGRSGPASRGRAQRTSRVRAQAPAAPRAADRGSAAERAIRDLLAAQLDGGQAFTTFAEAIRGLPAEARGVRPEGASHSPWEVLEHLRISTWDIVDFTRNPEHRSPSWPLGYWPETPEPPSQAAWEASVREFEDEVAAMKGLVADPRRDLFATIDHPEAKAHHTLAREAMVLAQHNGYHIAELILLRRILGAWPAS